MLTAENSTKAPSVSTPGYRETRTARLPTSRSASPRVTLAALLASRRLPAVSARGQRGGFTAPNRGASRRAWPARTVRGASLRGTRVLVALTPFAQRQTTRLPGRFAHSVAGPPRSLSHRKARLVPLPSPRSLCSRGPRTASSRPEPRQRAPGLTVQVRRPLTCCSNPRGSNSHPKTTPSEVQAASVRRSERDSATAKESVLTSPRSVPPVSAMARYWRVTAPRKYALRPCNTAAMAST